MAEYIEREAAKDELLSWAVCINHPEHLMREDAIHVLDTIPAADVSPVRHGRWERTADGAALCTACKRKMNPSQYGYAFCSLCGAKMDGQ